MKQFNASQTTLLTALGDGACHSGSELGQLLGITRSAIWKQIKQLLDQGVPIQSIPNQGYQLPSTLILLNQQHLTDQLLKQEITVPFHVHLYTSLDSTNRYLRDLPISNLLDICCAETQTQGRGRFGRQWHSPFGENIYCSSRWNLNYDLARLSGLSLIVSLAILRTLNEFIPTQDIKIKWPNDILWGDKKLCGSLIEIMAESNSDAQVIIGIGLNVNTDTRQHTLSDKAWCSLYEITERHFDRNQLIAALIANLDRYLTQFIHQDLNVFMDEWNQHDYLAGKYITVTQASGTISGVACGINSMGQLLLNTDSGAQLCLSSGDTSLKGA